DRVRRATIRGSRGLGDHTRLAARQQRTDHRLRRIARLVRCAGHVGAADDPFDSWWRALPDAVVMVSRVAMPPSSYAPGINRATPSSASDGALSGAAGGRTEPSHEL